MTCCAMCCKDKIAGGGRAGGGQGIFRCVRRAENALALCLASNFIRSNESVRSDIALDGPAPATALGGGEPGQGDGEQAERGGLGDGRGQRAAEADIGFAVDGAADGSGGDRRRRHRGDRAGVRVAGPRESF